MKMLYMIINEDYKNVVILLLNRDIDFVYDIYYLRAMKLVIYEDHINMIKLLIHDDMNIISRFL